MTKNKVKDLMMISVEKAIDLYLATLVTEGKSPRYVDWLKSRLKLFNGFLKETGRENYKLQNLTVDVGRDYLHFLMDRKKRYTDHPHHKSVDGKLTIYYIHGLGRALRSFSTWAYEEGYLEENIMRRLKLPKLPTTYPVPLSQEEAWQHPTHQQSAPAEWADLFQDPLLAWAGLDRLLDRAEVVVIRGPSYRSKGRRNLLEEVQMS